MENENFVDKGFGCLPSLVICVIAVLICILLSIILFPIKNSGIKIVIILCLAILIGAIALYFVKSKVKKKVELYLTEGFEKYYENQICKFLINKEQKKALVIDCEYTKFVENMFDFKEILNCEIIENGSTSMSTVSKHHASIGKAIVGGTLFGPTGAIIGGVSGKTNSKTSVNDICNELAIKITINNLDNPCVFLNLITQPIYKYSKQYKNLITDAQRILSLFQIIINENEDEKDTNQ